MKARRIVVVLVTAMLVYFVLIGYRAFTLLAEPGLMLKVFAVSILAFPVIGAWVVVAELRFGAATQRLGRALYDGVTDAVLLAYADAADLPRSSSGRVEAADADVHFARCRALAEESPGDWRSWFVLADAYDLCRDRRRAREAMRRAIRLAGGAAL